MILGWNWFTPKSTQFSTIPNLQQISASEKIKKILQIIKIPLKYTKFILKKYFPVYTITFTQKYCKVMKNIWIYDKPAYVYLKSLPKPFKFYTSVACDRFDI